MDMFSNVLGIYLGVEFLNHLAAICLTFSKIVAQFYTPTKMYESFNFSTTLHFTEY